MCLQVEIILYSEVQEQVKSSIAVFVDKKGSLSEVGFEPTPTEVDCDLNAAP